MTIEEAQFENENELHGWATKNIQLFLPNSIFIKGFQVSTISGKKGVPDGFAFNFQDREWFVIESELLHHGVWQHIAEQIVRFVVAMQNPNTLKIIRDKLFDHIMDNNLAAPIVDSLGTTNERLLQQIELFIEGLDPKIVIFINDDNQDLRDVAHALSVSTRIFRIQKFIVNGQIEYHSPDKNTPILVTDVTDEPCGAYTEYDVIEILGGGQLEASFRRFKCYRIADGSIVHFKRSKFYEDGNYYWYGLNATTLEYLNDYAVTHVVFIMSNEGFAVIPLDIIKQYIKHTKTSKDPNGNIRHYHCLISPGPKPELYWSNETPRYSLDDYYQTF